MALIPTGDQLKALQSVERSSNGIDAVQSKDDGLECVTCGWLEHREHRCDEGGLIDVWGLTPEGRRVLMSRASRAHSSSIPDEKAA